MSSTASVHSAKEVSPAERIQPVETVDEYEDAEENYQPNSLKFWMIIIGVYLSIFLVALVIFAVQVQTYCRAYTPLGSNHYCNGRSTHHRRIQLYPGHPLVWQCLHVDCRLFLPHLWPHLSALLDKMGFHAFNCHL